MIYFTADTHFGHSNIISRCNRPFVDLKQMHSELVRNWNAFVAPQDKIYILGDFAYTRDCEAVMQILCRLNGYKYLIRGNHDETYLSDPSFNQSLFTWIRDYHVLTYKHRHFVLFHYPIFEWEGFHGDAVHLYGHVHNHTKSAESRARFGHMGRYSYNVGVDENSYFPIGIDDVLALMQK